MNVCMITDVYFPRVNGVSTSIMTFRRSLKELGHTSTLVAPDYGDESHDAEVVRIASRHLFMDPEDRLMKIRRIRDLTACLRRRNFDIIHIQTPFVAHVAGMRLARALDLPVVETYHTHFEEYLYHYMPLLPKRFMRLLARMLTRHQAGQVDELIVPSLAMKEVLRSYGIRTPATILPTGIEVNGFGEGDRKAFSRRYGIDPRRPVLVTVGRVALEKNIGFLLDVVAELRTRLPDVLLIIAGEGPAQARLEKRITELEIEYNVMMIGYLERGQDLWNCYAAGDLFVFASKTETQGLVLLEAMALGVPVVSTAELGTRDILCAGKGALVSKPDINDFVEKIMQILSSKSLRERLAAEGREYVNSWSAEYMAKRLIDFYSRIIQERGTQACRRQSA